MVYQLSHINGTFFFTTYTENLDFAPGVFVFWKQNRVHYSLRLLLTPTVVENLHVSKISGTRASHVEVILADWWEISHYFLTNLHQKKVINNGMRKENDG